MSAAGLLRGIATPELRIFRPRSDNSRALLVIPGGGYSVVAVLGEGLEVAERMASAGYTVFVLVYRLPGEGWSRRADVPLQDAQRAIRLVRGAAPPHGFEARKVAVAGFSAGGHVAATLATSFAQEVYAPRDAIDRLDARPDAGGLIYPVISLQAPYAHPGVAQSLVGPGADAARLAARSADRRVSASTPPLFLAHAVDDTTVPMGSSILMLEAMKAARRPVEAHFFAEGGHGFGLGSPAARCAAWPGLFLDWLDRALAA
jgi:acetyl esterase/lipase